MTIILETQRLILREWRPEDADVLFAMCGDAETMRHIGDGKAWQSVERARVWLGRVSASYAERGYGPWAVVEKASGRVIGSCGYSFLPKLSEIDFGYVFARPYWGRGFATEAARAAFRDGFERLGFTEVTANTDLEHHVSRRVLEKIGFEYRGLRRYEGDAAASAFFVAKRPSPGGESACSPC
ncbi:MAG: GNAT family N-acetyltransferase [Acidobacteria bacterium]|nr:GNAT family N-acetyltransferase [Acidobacteriota bacterium]